MAVDIYTACSAQPLSTQNSTFNILVFSKLLAVPKYITDVDVPDLGSPQCKLTLNTIDGCADSIRLCIFWKLKLDQRVIGLCSEGRGPLLAPAEWWKARGQAEYWSAAGYNWSRVWNVTSSKYGPLMWRSHGTFQVQLTLLPFGSVERLLLL